MPQFDFSLKLCTFLKSLFVYHIHRRVKRPLTVKLNGRTSSTVYGYVSMYHICLSINHSSSSKSSSQFQVCDLYSEYVNLAGI